MSSEAGAVADAGASGAGAYTFRQLDAPVSAAGDRDVLAAALAEADAIREAARAEGEAAGRAEATAQVRAEAAESLALLAAAHDALRDLAAEALEALAADSAMLALHVAEQIIAGAIDVEPDRLVDVAGLALRRLVDRRAVTLVVNPSELEVLTAAVERLRGELGGIDHLSVQADRRVGRGGVVARTAEGEIDAEVHTQLARAREIVAAELAESSADSGDGAGSVPEPAGPSA